MAKNITQRITLAGGDAIRAALRGIGDAGAKAFRDLQNVSAANSRFKELGTTITAVAARMAAFGTAAKTAGADAAAFGNAVGGALTRVTLLTGGLTAAASKLVGAFKAAGNENEELEQNANAVGITTQEYKNLTNALGQNGVGTEEAGKALDRMAKFMRTAAEQNDDYTKKIRDLNKENLKGGLSFDEYRKKLRDIEDGMGSAAKITDMYGIKVRNADGSFRVATDVLLDFGDALQGQEDKTLANAQALEIWGRAGRKIGQVAAMGSDNLNRLIQESAKIAPALGKDAERAVADMDGAFDKIDIVTKSLKTSLLAVFAPDVTSLFTTFSNTIGNNREKFIQVAESVRASLKPALDSLLETLNSPDAGQAILVALNGIIDAAKALGTALTTFIIPAFKAIYAGAEQLAQLINSVFGTELTGGVLLAGTALAKFTGLIRVATTGFGLLVSVGKLLLSGLALLGPALIGLVGSITAPGLAIAGLVAAFGYLVYQVVTNFPKIVETVSSVFSRIIGIFTQFPGNVANIFNFVGRAIMAAFEVLAAWFAPYWERIVADARLLPGKFAMIWAIIVAYAKTVWDSVSTYIMEVFGRIYAGLVAEVEKIIAGFAYMWEGIQAGAGFIVEFFMGIWNSISTSVNDFVNSAIQFVTDGFTTIKNVASDLATFVIQKFNDMIAAVRSFLGIQAEAGGDAGGEPQRNARGGYIRGRGTGTSDSILSWLSNGEFVVKAKAVQHYGPQLLHALNRMQLPKFAAGGLASVAQSVMPPMPRFAEGGLAMAGARAAGGGGDRPFTLNIGNETFTGLRASSGAIEELTRYASGQQIRRAGRMPNWYRG